MFDEIKDAITPENVPKFRPELAYPSFSDEMLNRLKMYGDEEQYQAGVILFNRGERGIDLFAVLDGRIEIFTSEGDDAITLYELGERQFSGELDLLNRQRTLTGARTLTACRLLHVARAQLQRLMRAEGDIANLIMQATIWRRLGLVADPKGGVVLIGQPDEAETVLLQRFLIRNGYPYKSLDSREGYDSNPVVVLDDGRVLHRPTIPELADELGIAELPAPNTIFDVTVVGAGPGGLAAAVYAASEGLSTLVVEGVAPGGQAGTSSKIENYLGFPTGISGNRLAHRAHVQALKFGAQIAISRTVVSMHEGSGIHQLTLSGGTTVCTRSVVVATGARYRKLDLEDYARFENQGIYYAATAMESLLCKDHEVIVVGGGNSAGQAAVFLSGVAAHVHLIVRAKSLASTMSQYLISRIEGSSRITLYVDSEITRLDGQSRLDAVQLLDRATDKITTMPIRSVFVMIGAEPNTGWLYGSTSLDRKGFILTGGERGFENTPYATSLPGVYAVGDVRAGSVKRVASAVGEGSVVISDVHRYLAQRRETVSADPAFPPATV